MAEMAETVQSMWHRITGALRRAVRKFESERDGESSTWELTVHVEPDEIDAGWIAWVDELPGCVSTGVTAEEARRNLGEAIVGVLEVKVVDALGKDGGDVPTVGPSTRHVKIA